MIKCKKKRATFFVFCSNRKYHFTIKSNLDILHLENEQIFEFSNRLDHRKIYLVAMRKEI